jgi:VWFA-related protein
MRNRMELRSRMSLTMTLAIALMFAGLAHAGQANITPLAEKPADKGSVTESHRPVTELRAEVSNQDVPTIKLRVNLVQVKVVVRNEKGESVKGLQREDFQVYDSGKLQLISTFGVETPETFRKREEAAAKTEKAESSPGIEREGIPQRYVAVVFDDVHLQTTDILPVRAGSEKLIDSLKPGDRIGIFSTSGQMTEQFTSDKEALKKKLKSLAPRPIMGKINATSTCPEVTYYMADQYVNQHNTEILDVATAEALECAFHFKQQYHMAAKSMAESLLKQQLTAGNADNEASYRRMEEVLREMSRKPGERVVILVSPGFLLASLYSDEMGMIERANRAGVVINTLDSRGLFNPGVAADDISKPVTDTVSGRIYKANYRMAAQIDADSVLRDFAESTGGTFFHNSNDLAGGMQQLGAAPGVSYLLGYSPQDQKMDGKYHLIKVALPGKGKYEVQARHGYYAPKKVDNPEEKANQEIQDAVYSQGEIDELPLEIHTQYRKAEDGGVQLTVISHVGAKDLPFRQADGRHFDKLTVTTVIFNQNGDYVSGGQKLLNLELPDETYAKVSRYGLQITSTFALKPGRYTVRQVVREAEGAEMAAKNGEVVIPE